MSHPPEWVVKGATRYADFNSYKELLRPYKSGSLFNVSDPDTVKFVKPIHQVHQLKELLQGPRDELVCITGTRTEAMPFFLTHSISERFATLRRGKPFTWVSLRHDHMPFFDSSDTLLQLAKHSAIVFYNVLPDSSMYRIEKLKDCLDITAKHGIMRFVVLGGAEPVQFCIDRLRAKPQCALYIESNQ